MAESSIPNDSRMDKMSREKRMKKPKLSEGMVHLCMTEKFADVYFVFVNENRKRISAHKNLLALVSEVFEKMFEYNNEDNDCSTVNDGSVSAKRMRLIQEVEIKDKRLDSSTFEAMLFFIYSAFGEIKLTKESVWNILYAAKFYIIDALEKYCVEFLAKNLSVENVFSVIKQCTEFDINATLLEHCHLFISLNTKKIIGTENMPKITRDDWIVILEQDRLSVGEKELFESILCWAKLICESKKLSMTPNILREIIGARAFELIRFGLIQKEQFMVVAESKLLTVEEERDILMDQLVLIAHQNFPLERRLTLRDDPHKPEGTVVLYITKFAEFVKGGMSNMIYGDTVYIRGLPWRLMAQPHYHDIPSERLRLKKPIIWNLAIFLQCNSGSTDPTWDCDASATIAIIAQDDDHSDFEREITHNFHSKSIDWGYKEFVKHDRVLDIANGLIDENGTVTIMAEVSADQPFGI